MRDKVGNDLTRQLASQMVTSSGLPANPRQSDNLRALGGLGEWGGWHAARRGLGSNLYRLGCVSEKVIQRILRHANVSTTATYYIKTAR